VWAEIPVIVVRDEPELLAAYIAEGAPLRFPPGDWPTPTGLHPWHGKAGWRGPGVLMLHRPDDAYAVWVFRAPVTLAFRGWYVNMQEPFRRRPDGYDTQDLELDLWLPAGGGLEWKDDDVLEQRVAEGRFTREQIEATRAEARRVEREIEEDRRWWSDEWATWAPEPEWPVPDFPA
jgi:hypothetical protein